MVRPLRAASAALAFTLGIAASAGSLHAAGEGRVHGTVLDGTGAAIEGAVALLTRQGGYKLEKKTDKKGQFTMLVLDATQEYQIRIEKEGYSPFEAPVKPKLEDTLRLTFTLEKAAAAAPTAEQAEAVSTANQAIQAFNEGVIALQANDMATAAAKFQQASDLDPKLPDAPGALADVLLELKKPAEALVAADRYLALKPNDPKGLRARYDALKSLGRTDEAKEALTALSSTDKSRDTAVRLMNEGIGFFNAGKAEEALPLFETAAAADPTLAKAYYMLGLTYINTGDTAKAKEHLQKFLEMAPSDPDAATAKEMLESLK